MSKITTLLNKILVFVVFLPTCTRLAVARIFSHPDAEPPSARVFALSETAWLELRAVADGQNQDQRGPKAGDNKADSKAKDKDKEGSKTGEEKKPDTKAKCDKGAPNSDAEKKTVPPSGECTDEGPGGGDGDMGGGGG